MNAQQPTRDEIADRALALYDRDIRPHVEAEHRGKFLVLDVDTGDYEIDTNTVPAFDRLIARRPDGHRFLLRIGHATAFKIGGRIRKV